MLCNSDYPHSLAPIPFYSKGKSIKSFKEKRNDSAINEVSLKKD